MRLRLGLDARNISSFEEGISRHLRRVIEELAVFGGCPALVSFVTPHDQHDLDKALTPSALNVVHPVTTTARLHSLRGHLLLSAQVRRERLKVFHSHRLFVPLLPGCSPILTIHDIIPLKFPELYPGVAAYMQRVLPIAVHRAKIIMVDSQATQRDLEQRFPLASQKICVVGLGVEEHFRPLNSDAESKYFRARWELPEKFVLWIGATRPTKNVSTLVEAFSHLKQKARLPHKLVLTRGSILEDRKIIRSIRQHRLMEDVIFLNAVPEDNMPLLYNAADLFVFPSLYEGFGLPPLEAMACGTPVVCSNAASLPEVVGDAAIQVNPHDALELAAAMWMVLSERGLREQLIEDGLQRARHFTWRRTADETLDVYQNVLAQRDT